jgi:hypothetical protein
MRLLDLDDMNMRGSQIWVGFKNHCEGEIDVFLDAVKNRDPELVKPSMLAVRTVGTSQLQSPILTLGPSKTVGRVTRESDRSPVPKRHMRQQCVTEGRGEIPRELRTFADPMTLVTLLTLPF